MTKTELEAKVAALEDDLRHGDDLRERMADILSRTAIALRGPEPPLTKWSWHDLPDRAQLFRDAVQQTLDGQSISELCLLALER